MSEEQIVPQTTAASRLSFMFVHPSNCHPHESLMLSVALIGLTNPSVCDPPSGTVECVTSSFSFTQKRLFQQTQSRLTICKTASCVVCLQHVVGLLQLLNYYDVHFLADLMLSNSRYLLEHIFIPKMF